MPVFLDDLGEFGTTRFAIEDALKFHKTKPLSRQLEIETYTWDVLPDHLKTGDIVDYVSREIEWVAVSFSSATAIARVCHEGRFHRDGPHGSGHGPPHARSKARARRLQPHAPRRRSRWPMPARKSSARSPTLPRYGDAVYTMLADDAALEDVVFQSGGLLASLPKGGIHVCAGTHGIPVIRKIKAAHAENGQILVARPMLGRPELVVLRHRRRRRLRARRRDGEVQACCSTRSAGAPSRPAPIPKPRPP